MFTKHTGEVVSILIEFELHSRWKKSRSFSLFWAARVWSLFPLFSFCILRSHWSACNSMAFSIYVYFSMTVQNRYAQTWFETESPSKLLLTISRLSLCALHLCSLAIVLEILNLIIINQCGISVTPHHRKCFRCLLFFCITFHWIPYLFSYEVSFWKNRTREIYIFKQTATFN